MDVSETSEAREAKQRAIWDAADRLTEWAANRDTIDRERDERVRSAYAMGIGKSRIAQLTGLARDTVNRILREPRP